MSADHVRQSRLAALSSRLQRRKEQLERDVQSLEATGEKSAAGFILEARVMLQRAQSALEGKSPRLPSRAA